MPESHDYRECPYCSEEIKVGALTCKHCKINIESADKSKSEEPISSGSGESITIESKNVRDKKNTDFVEQINLEPSIVGETQKMQGENLFANNENDVIISSNKQNNMVKSNEKAEKVQEEGDYVVMKIKFLEFVAWTYFGLSVLGGIIIWNEIGFALGFVVILQAIAVAGFLLVFCDMALNVNIMKNKLVASETLSSDEQDVYHNLDESLVKRATELKIERPNWTISQIAKELGKEGFDIENIEQINYVLKSRM
jgi:hypothetical protein